MRDASPAKTYALHIGVIALLFALNFILPDYHQGLFARIMALAVFAMGYNLLFGYVGLLSLGHAMFFSAGLYGAGLTVYHLGWGVPEAFLAGVACGALLALVIGLLALRTSGVAFMIVTMMFAQVFYLLILYFAAWTGGDQGLVIQQASRVISIGGASLDLTNPTVRYMGALALFSVALLITLALVRSRFGRVLVAIRENEERTKMLGYDTVANKLISVVASGAICAASGAAYALLFGYVGSNFASIQYSILPLLWVLLGGAATTLGPLIGTLFMYYVTDITSGFTSAYLLIVGVALILLVLFAPKGIMGSIRERWLGWLP
ncbi:MULTISPECIES: branched-chain amino acid ABC transporter permease [unclassified Mesorhizobium]|uniref:branched-chain amino acid ABC transporter permease n=1 Tax=unclassified Mesorhizobium TaxID=325217 RepID=UPI000F7568DE|nr:MULTISPECIES: branched-chain amino acid ABC transporter permease [unclassified Mesorhizobium]AZO04652.1 branched-chain amino acid ABC transporter permease [Mesorhizobium sp. M2A.F.Ca.ET.043.02.1.1]RUW34176.1 branched-chain amino acid ABC transporter permease [Mesorhizobium sp. M2A.F.Ca.ET.015.02.1.1]RUW80563.1 branched-chain amino acid ABC transporter permease [Mesorhizobium sp. M2A.F.Ca.ET.067.02.1.1]RVC90888.1 branched-chain amino acid ABC transporter permease [Mesorhizobium sp. M2A.F.Ca.E